MAHSNVFFLHNLQTFLCRKGGNCDVDVSVRCACRACRLAKCKAAGMRESGQLTMKEMMYLFIVEVQPKRDPTGSQKNRRAPQRRRGTNGLLMVKKECGDAFESEFRNNPALYHMPNKGSPGTILPSVENSQCPEKGLLACIPLAVEGAQGSLHSLHNFLCTDNNNPYRTMLSPTTASFPPSAESGIFEEPSSGGGIVFLKTIKKEESEYPADEADDSDEEADADEAPGSSVQMRVVDELASPNDPQQNEFEGLVRDYREHLLCMNRSMTSIENFLSEESGSVSCCNPFGIIPSLLQCSKWRVMEPTDVDQLSKVELGGLMYWIEKLWPFRRLAPKDREILFKRYSMRKLSLDHFYTASKYPELLAEKNFAMLNNTYVPPDRTGFETVTDDKHTREAKFQILRPTLDRLWDTIVQPFAGMRITDEEIVALHLLLMWSPSSMFMFLLT